MAKLVVLLCLASFLMFWGLGAAHLTNWDEAWYADVARTMSETGNGIVPVWNGQPFFEKPPLFYWLSALSFRMFGDQEFSARFISALAGVATVGLVYWFSLRHWGHITAFLCSLILLSTPAFLWRARTGNFDSLLTLFMLLTAIAVVEMNKKNIWAWILGVATGLAFLTKGAIGFLFPLVALGFWFWQKEGKLAWQLVKGLGVGVLISASWLGISYFINGQVFVTQFLTQQTEKIGSPTSLVRQFSFEHLMHLKSGLKLWILVFVPSVFYALVVWKKKLVLLPWFVLIFLILLSFLREKSSWFLHPAFPFIALICAATLTEWGKKIRFGHSIIMVAVVIVASFQLIRFHREYFVPDVAADEANVALFSKEVTAVDDVVYLTHYYFPTAVYYSRRKTYAVYSEGPTQSWWILPKSAWEEILRTDRVFINTSVEDLKQLETRFPDIRFDVLFQSGDKLLVKKSP